MAQITLSETLTIVGGGTVVVTTRDGRIDPDTMAGVLHADRRVIAALRTSVDGHALALVATTEPTASRSVTHHLVLDERDRPVALLTTTRDVAGKVEQTVVVRALGAPSTLTIRAHIAADLADLQRLRYGAAPPEPSMLTCVDGSLVATDGDLRVVITAPDASVRTDGDIAWTVEVAPGAPATTKLTVCTVREDIAERTPAARQPRRSRGDDPRLRVTRDHRWQRAVDTSLGDLDALRVDVATPVGGAQRDLSYTAAGAPWYMALFGRDALLTAYESLLTGADQALDTLDALAAFQGRTDDPDTGERPGMILHELRTGCSGIFGLAPFQPYFGSVDATPLFVLLLGEAYRWGASPDRVRALLPAARAAIGWCTATADRDPRGHLTYEPDEGALRNKGWKDSADSMVHADGGLADGPIAVIEAQAYHWRALRELAALERALGDDAATDALVQRADAVAAAIVRDFWIADRRLLAMAVDGAGEPLGVASSNAGHCLWTGAVDGDIAAAVADLLGSPALDAGWGIRTLGADETAYDPMSYHCGSVWPHDSALIVDGLARTGHPHIAARTIAGLLDAAEHHRWRLPELYGGYGPDEVPAPVPYPVACSPQAWSAAVPLQLLRTLLRIEPDVPAGTVTVGPALTDVTLRVDGIRLGDHTLDISVVDGHIDAHADSDLTVMRGG